MIAIPYEFAKDMSDGGHYADWQFRKTVIELDVTDWDISRRTSLKNFFAECVNLKVIHGLDTWDVSNIRSFEGMFRNCKSLESISFAGWNTKNLETTFRMFEGCSSLQSTAGLQYLDVSHVVDMRCMFKWCSSLVYIELLGWKPCRRVDIDRMFDGCTSLQSINGLEAFSKTTFPSLIDVFQNCKSIEILDLSKLFITRVATFDFIAGCDKLTTIILPRYMKDDEKLTKQITHSLHREVDIVF